MFKIYILPKLEFCNVIWSNNLKTQSDKIEQLQKRTCRYAADENSTYEAKLILTNSSSLVQRRNTQLIITGLKILRNFYDSTTKQVMLSHVDTNYQQGRNFFNLNNNRMLKSNPIYKMMATINNYSRIYNINADSIYTIKNKLKKYHLELNSGHVS